MPKVEKFYRQFGERFRPEQFRREKILRINFDLPMYRVSDEIPRLIYDYARSSLDHESYELFQGDVVRVGPQEVAFSNYANPCLVILLKHQDGDYYLMHAMGNSFSLKEKEALEQSRGGIAGGGMAWFEENGDILQRANIIAISPNTDEHDFALTIARRPVATERFYKTPGGIYFTYHKFDRNFPRDLSDFYEG